MATAELIAPRIHFRHRNAQELGQHLPCRYSLLRELQELLRGELALGLDLAEGPNDGLQHLLASTHGSNGVADGSDHLEYAVGREPIRQELTCRLLQADDPEGCTPRHPSSRRNQALRRRQAWSQTQSATAKVSTSLRLPPPAGQRMLATTVHLTTLRPKARLADYRGWTSKRFRLALDGAGEFVPLPLSPSHVADKPARRCNQCDIERRYGGHSITPK